MMWASFAFFGDDNRLNVASSFEKEVDPFATSTTIIGAEVEFLIASAVAVRKFPLLLELAMTNSIFDRAGETHDFLVLKPFYFKNETHF